MSDSLDPRLARLFATADERLDGGKFIAEVTKRIARARRYRLRRRLLAATALSLVFALNLPSLLGAAALLVHSAGEYSSAAAEFCASPAGWVTSMLIGAWVFLRVLIRTS